jgi:hypothetical protein
MQSRQRAFFQLFVVLAACAPTTPTTTPASAPAPAAPATVVIGPAASPSNAVSVAPEPPPPPKVCDNDNVETSPDCGAMPGLLGDCGAMAYYACPAQEKLPEGKRFRAGTAARIAACYARTPRGQSCEPFEACVREGVAGACAEEAQLAWCKANLPACNPQKHELCAKFLSSLEPKLRSQAIENLKQLNGKRLQTSCKLTWDIAGYPFCPFCRFGE